MSFDVIILGLGAMGSAAAHHLAQRGMRVLGIDQFTPPHNRGSSHGGSRMIRQAYWESPDYIPLVLRAYDLWRSLEKDTGTHLRHITG
ncbi:FAD-dependent oxidoreductase, partial [Bradyrhizobium sp.]